MMVLSKSAKLGLLAVICGVLFAAPLADAQCVDPDVTRPVITVNTPYVYRECDAGGTFADEEYASASDDCDGDITARIVSVNPVDLTTPGTYTITYNVTDAAGNPAIQQVKTVRVADTQKPVLDIDGQVEMVVACGTEYVEPAKKAFDACEGDITSKIQKQIENARGEVVAAILTDVPGFYTITYSVADDSGNSTYIVRWVEVTDDEGPVMTLNDGLTSIELECNEPYTETGATAIDQCYGDLTDEIVISPDLDGQVLELQDYEVSYFVRDPSGNETTLTRTVTVSDTLPPVITLQGTFTSECGEPLSYPGESIPGRRALPTATALDSCEGPVAVEVTDLGGLSLDDPQNGLYTVTYTATDISGNTATANLYVEISDTKAPVVIINNGLPFPIQECHVPFALPGAQGIDDCDGEVSASVYDDGDLDTNCPDKGDWTVTYISVDSSGNEGFASIVIRVRDTRPPEIIQCALDMTLEVTADGSGSSTFAMPNYTEHVYAWDLCEDICPVDHLDAMQGLTITQSCPAGTNITLDTLPAEKIITMTVTDSSGNFSDCQLILTVVNRDAPVISLRGVEDDDVDPPYNDDVLPGYRNLFYSDACTASSVPSDSSCAVWGCGIQQSRVTWECSVPFDPWCGTAYDPVTGNDITGNITIAYRRLSPGGTRWEDGVDVMFVDTSDQYQGYTYIMRYTVTNAAGVTTTVERWIRITDTTQPVISLRSYGGLSGEASTGYNYDPTNIVDQSWLETMRDGSLTDVFGNIIPEWIRRILSEEFCYPAENCLLPPVDFDPETAMRWDCWHLDYEDPGIDVHDACEGTLDEERVLDDTLAVIVKVYFIKQGGYWLEEFVVAEMLRYLGDDLPRLDQSWESDERIFYGYRIYYFTPDSSGNRAHVARHVSAQYFNFIALAAPTTIEIDCEGDLGELERAERQDRAWDSCMGDATHVIVRSGQIAQRPDGSYIPGTYYREYWLNGFPVPPSTVNPYRRQIVVRDTDPVVHLYDESSEEYTAFIPVTTVHWCEFLEYPGATLEEQAINWANDWWVIQPDGSTDDGVIDGGYNATHICDNEDQLTDWMHVHGDAVLRDAMVTFASSGDLYSLDAYNLVFSLNDPRHNLVQRNMVVLLTEDIQFDLVHAPGGEVEYGPDGEVTVTVECGSPMMPIPQVGRQWDACSGEDVQRQVVIQAFRVTGEGDPPPTEPVDYRTINTSTPGTYLLNYYAVISAAAPLALVRTVELRIVDSLPPVITLVGDQEVEIDCTVPYIDPGATAVDACDGNLTSSIVISGYPITPAVGSVGYRTYTVTDSSGNSASVTRTILVPSLTLVLNGVDSTEAHPTYGTVYVTEWECNKPYVDPGVASARDDCTGESVPVSAVEVSGVPTTIPGNGSEFFVTYTLSYNGSTATVRRLVRVMNADGPLITLEGEGVAPVDLLEETDPEPEWWQDALDAYLEKYPETSGYPQLPEDWRVAESWDTSLSDPLPWNCNLPAYEDPGLNVEDVCEGVLDPANVVLILTRFNAEESSERFCYAGRFGDFAADPPGEAYDDDGVALPDGTPRNLLEDQSRAVWSGYRAYYIAWDSEGNFSVQSRLIAPAYLELSVSPAEMTVECSGELPLATILAADLCYSTPLTPVRWIWHNDPGTGLEMDGATPVDYTEEEALSQPGAYVIVYAATDAYGNTVPELDAFGQPVDPEALVEAGGPYLQQLTVRDTLKPVITLTGDASVQLSYGEAWVEPGYSAADVCDGDLTGAVSISGTVNPVLLGPQPLVYSVTDGAGNRGQVTRTVYVLDMSELEITVNPPLIPIECGTVYVDSGVTARDNRDGADLTGSIRVSGLISALVGSGGARPGTYTITYTVSRVPDGNEASATRTVVVTDSAAPVLTLRGDADVTVDCGASYRDAGVMSAMDDCDGDVYQRVVQTGNVDTNVPGLQVITFSARDSAGNVGTALRNVTVRDNCKSDEGEGEVVFEGELEGEPVGPVQVPDVTLQTPEAAQAVLAAVGLVVGEVTCVCNDTVPQGSIISQDPAPGTVVDGQSAVNLVVSDGPCASCGCEGFEEFNWANVFLGILAVIVLLLVSLTVGGGIVKI